MSAKTTPLDAVEAALLDAPEGDPLTDDERRLLVEAHASIAAGRLHTHDEILAVIDEMRRLQEG